MTGLATVSGLVVLVSLLGGCGLAQSVTDGTVDAARAIFYKKIKVLHLDFEPRAAINADRNQTPFATMVRVYQLKERKNIDSADYQALLNNADATLGEEVLASKAVLVMPEGRVSLNMPMDADAQFVAVVALFHQPDLKNDKWRVVLSRDELDADKARVLALGDGWLNLLSNDSDTDAQPAETPKDSDVMPKIDESNAGE
jgi:type VI secretion system protein VasD